MMKIQKQKSFRPVAIATRSSNYIYINKKMQAKSIHIR